ncbi:hypothetical protein BDF14DRAFT_1683515, partial [Spinellus fusiger]
KRVQGWSCAWGQKEDAMLLVGVHLYGFGRWLDIQEDPTLDLTHKFFLHGQEEDKDHDKRTPKSIHLGRRAEQLMKILAEDDKSDLSHGEQRKSSKHTAHGDSTRHTPKPRSRGETSTPVSEESASHKSKKGGQTGETRKIEGFDNYDEEEAHRTMRPMRDALYRLRDESPKLAGPEKAQLIRECIQSVGRYVDKQVANLSNAAAHLQTRCHRDLWLYTTKFWPNTKVSHLDLIEVYGRI